MVHYIQREANVAREATTNKESTN